MKPLLVYDGDCNFCRRWVLRWRALTGDKAEYSPFQEASSRLPQIPLKEFKSSVQLVEADGKVTKGAEAVFRLLSYAPQKRGLLFLYERVPPFRWAADLFYRKVADHRRFFSFLTSALWGKSLEPPKYFLARRLYLGALALIYFSAFFSLWVQIDGLIGTGGILPIQDYLKAVQAQAGSQGYGLLPTLLWLNSSDFFLNLLCAGGAFLSLALFFNKAPALALALLWAFYLSLTVACRDFLGFQWDNLLLEMGFLSIFFVPWSFRGGKDEEAPPACALWLLRLLLFKFMFSSGCVKLLSGDPSWWSLTALNYHYETQPLPTWIAWHAHQLPEWFHKLSMVLMFAIELFVPFFVFLPRLPRLAAFGSFLFLQALIVLTGNYCFFNLQAAALSLLLLEDSFLGRFFKKSGSLSARPASSPGLFSRARSFIFFPAACLYLFICGAQIFGMFYRPIYRLGPVRAVMAKAEPFRTVNSYGLFAVMTTSRPEIILEGSQDGRSWKEYGFKFKPGDLKIPPRFNLPHQPRLDWQMWFAALGSYEANPWFLSFSARILRNSPEVLALMAQNPFPGSPPRYLRALLYEYRFTSPAEKKADGSWWKRELKGLYCPVLSLKQDGL